MGGLMRVLIVAVAVLLSTYVAVESGKPDDRGAVVLDQGEKPAKELKPDLGSLGPGEGSTAAIDLGPSEGSPTLPELGTTGHELPPALSDVEWQSGSPKDVTTGEPGTILPTMGEGLGVVARFFQQKMGTKDQFKGKRDLQRREGVHHSTVSAEDIQTILDMHNDYRSNVNPTAKAMVKMYWHPKLADSAQEIADECRDGEKHDHASERRTKSKLGVPVGQNYALGPYNTAWSNVLAAWHAEKKDFRYGVEVSAPVGHYTQEVRGPSTHVGCGSKECPNLTKDGQRRSAFYCNYAQMNMDYIRPYQLGHPCEACPDRCVDNLCDCGSDLLCESGSIPDYNTCTCTCKFGFKGKNCSECPLVDMSYNCKIWSETDCDKATNVRDECPIMCGDCDKKCSNDDLRCTHHGNLTEVGDGTCKCTCPSGCYGSTCACETSWTQAQDNPACASVPKDEYCKYSNIRDDMCKYTCHDCEKEKGNA